MKLHPVRLVLFFVFCLVLSSMMISGLAETGEATQQFRSPWERSVPFSLLMKSTEVSKVKFTKNTVNVTIGKTYDLKTKLTVLPASAIDKSVVWNSNKETVAIVDNDGIVNVIGEGTATITATSKSNPLKSDTIKIVGKAVRVKSISMVVSNVVLDENKKHAIQTTIKPATASFQTIEWSTNSPAVATVDEDGVVQAHAPGTCVITARTDKGKKKANFTVRVRGGTMRTVKLSAVGDTVVGGDKRFVKRADGLYSDGLTSFARFEKLFQEKGPNYFFDNVKSVFHNDDVTVVNFEGTLTNRKSHYSKTFAFRGYPYYNQLVRDAGVDVACLANNHSYDFKDRGYADTRKNLNAVDIRSFGIGSRSVVTREVNGVKMGFAGFTMPASYSDVAASIRKLKREKKCEVVVVSFHWTQSKEWTTSTTNSERNAARFAIKNGANLVLGHHKHVIGAVEQYKGKMIVYELGNFLTMIRNQLVAGGPYTDKDTVIYQQRFNVFEDGFVEHVDPNFIPCMNSDALETMTGNPRVVSGLDAERVLGKLRDRSSAGHQALVKYDPSY